MTYRLGKKEKEGEGGGRETTETEEGEGGIQEDENSTVEEAVAKKTKN